MKLVLTQASRNDLEEIGDHIALHSPVAARRLVGTIRECAREIVRFPHAYPELEVENGGPVRRRVVANYLIVYRVEADRIVVLRIVHAARDLAHLLDSLE